MEKKKKEYINPKFELVEMQVCEVIAASVSISDEETDDDAIMVNKNPNGGNWGNLWQK